MKVKQNSNSIEI